MPRDLTADRPFIVGAEPTCTGSCLDEQGRGFCDCLPDVPEVETPEQTHPWLWALYAAVIVGTILVCIWGPL